MTSQNVVAATDLYNPTARHWSDAWGSFARPMHDQGQRTDALFTIRLHSRMMRI